MKIRESASVLLKAPVPAFFVALCWGYAAVAWGVTLSHSWYDTGLMVAALINPLPAFGMGFYWWARLVKEAR